MLFLQRAFISNLVGKNANIFYDTLKDAIRQRLQDDDVKLHAIESYAPTLILVFILSLPLCKNCSTQYWYLCAKRSIAQ